MSEPAGASEKPRWTPAIVGCFVLIGLGILLGVGLILTVEAILYSISPWLAAAPPGVVAAELVRRHVKWLPRKGEPGRVRLNWGRDTHSVWLESISYTDAASGRSVRISNFRRVYGARDEYFVPADLSLEWEDGARLTGEERERVITGITAILKARGYTLTLLTETEFQWRRSQLFTPREAMDHFNRVENAIHEAGGRREFTRQQIQDLRDKHRKEIIAERDPTAPRPGDDEPLIDSIDIR